MAGGSDLQQAFHRAFIEPFAFHTWGSRRSRWHWVELEGWEDAIAGPGSSIAENGGCDYVYSRDDHYFAGVDDPESLRRRLLEWHAELAAGVERFRPSAAAERADLEFMRSLVADMQSLIQRAMAVELHRWQGSRGSG